MGLLGEELKGLVKHVDIPVPPQEGKKSQQQAKAYVIVPSLVVCRLDEAVL